GWDSSAKRCDYCRSVGAVLFCCAESTFLCIACDNRIHVRGEAAARHGRVWVCEVCEQAPAAFACKADSASLCVECDGDIHSANPLARRHERAPVLPFYDSAEAAAANAAAASSLLVPVGGGGDDIDDDIFAVDPIVTRKLDPIDDGLDFKSVEFLFSDLDQTLDFDNFRIYAEQNDGVSVDTNTTSFGMNFYDPNFNAAAATTSGSFTTRSNSVSSSSIDGGEISHNFRGGQPSSSIDDRKARVLRYREKRRNRNFEKTIRYASRKAYAETRPRIKGRFVKKTSESDGNFSSGDGDD
ncbi:hypothetical protein M569_09948, partial [Genlisea aurea]